jgi:DNA-binding GntR family transcriptional regulator
LPRLRAAHRCNSIRDINVALDQILEKVGKVGNAAETAYAVLREAIVTNALAPGTRLRADDLAKRLGVSKTPVREALRKLQAEELIAVQPGTGLSVKVLSEQELFDIYYIREALEGMAARLAADNCGPLELSELRHALADVEAALADSQIDRLRVLTGKFQLAVFRAARNERLYRLLKHLQEHMRQLSTSTLTVPGRAVEVGTHCRALVAAIAARDPEQAERVARDNRRRTLELRLRILRSSATT